MKNIDDISEKVEKRKKQLQPLFEKDKENYDLWIGKEQKFDDHPMSVNITGTEMTALPRRVQASLTRSRLAMRVLAPDPMPNPKATDTANREEDMYYHGFEMADERLAARGEATLLSSIAWQAIVLGRMAVRVRVYEKDGEIVWDYHPMIPSFVVFEFDEDGLAWYAYETFRSPSSVEREYGKEVTEEALGKGVSVTDHWDREHNVRYLTKDKEALSFKVGAKKATSWGNKFGEVPAIILPITLGPRAINTEGVDVTTWGQSIFDHVKIPFRNLNKLRSIVATQAFINAQPPLVVTHKDGTDQTIEEKDLNRYPMAMINVPDTVELKVLDTKDVPPSILTMMGDISTGIQRATYTELSPDIPGHSGSALKILRQDMQDVLSPRSDGINRLYTGISRMAKRQILAQDLTIPVRTVVDDNYQIYDMTPEFLENDFYVSAQFIRQDVYDEVEALQEAQLLQDNRWMSRKSIMEKKLKMQDVPTEITEMDIDEVEAAIPEMKLRRMIKDLRLRSDDLLRQGIEDNDLLDKIKMMEEELGMLIAQKQQALMGGQPPQGGVPPGGTPPTRPPQGAPR